VGEGFCRCLFGLGGFKAKCVIINVYFKCDLEEKRRLWNKLLEVRKEVGVAAWCILVDFNAVCNRDERMGVNVEQSPSQVLEMNLFMRFLREVELEDVNLLVRRYTWYHLMVSR
jgi:hypothetical protein